MHIGGNLWLHLICIDEILFFSVRNLEKLQGNIDLFCKVVNILVNKGKLTISGEGFEEEYVDFINNLSPIKWIYLDKGLKYLGFRLNLDAYVNKDWDWLIINCEKLISTYSFWWLSKGGRLVLVKLVLEAILVY